jgi:hypothetical protein
VITTTSNLVSRILDVTVACGCSGILEDVYATQSSGVLSPMVHRKIDEIAMTSAQLASGIVGVTDKRRRLGIELTSTPLQTHLRCGRANHTSGVICGFTLFLYHS